MSSNVNKIGKDSTVKQIWVSMEDLSEDKQPDSEDLPPSYALAIFRDCVAKAMLKNKEGLDSNVVTNQPSLSSLHLSNHSSLASTEFTLNSQKIEPMKPNGPVSYAWSDKIVNKNIHERDRMTLLCFCVSTITALFTLTFYCAT